MRIAVIQLAAQREPRTAIFQRALQAIDTAAETDPAPDLILLPAFSDVPAILRGDTFITEQSAGPTAAACGLRARQWGIFIALGIAEPGSDKPYVTTVLIDRDSDLRLACRQQRFSGPAEGRFASGARGHVADVLLGRIALLTGDDLLDDAAWDDARHQGAGIVLGSACWANDGRDPAAEPRCIHSRIAANAKRCGIACAVADVTTAEADVNPACPGASAIITSDGRVLHAAETGSEATLWAQVEVPQIEPNAGGKTQGG
ncbi:MAG: carbon-nitrogen hydrolase family protein [Planctomycetota bacterium]